MSNPVPNQLALTSIADGSPRTAAPVRNNFAAIQSAFNAIVTLLSGGLAGQVLTAADASNVEWADPAGLPAGAMVQYGAAAAPTGWLLCDGTAVSRTTYASLFAAIGSTYGAGDGTTTFNVPDLVGRVPVGRSISGPAAINALGKNDGVTKNNRNIDHHHQYFDTGVAGTHGGSGSSSTGGLANTSGDANNSVPAFLVVNYIIKT